MNIHANTPYEIHDGETIRRAFTGPVIKGINKEERQIEFVISTAAEDRYGDVITVSGWDLKMYKQNPVVLFGHVSSVPPIGKAIKTWKDGDALRSIAQFMPADLSAFADSIFRMYLEGYLRAVSVGFRPIKYERILDEEGNPTYAYKFLKQELLEFSAVPIPANPEALIAARQKGIDTMPFKSWAEEMLDNWSVVDKDMNDIYGVGRKDIENIRRRAAGAGAAIQVPVEIQDDLLRRNLEAVRKSKAEKAAAKEFLTIDFGNEEYELPLRKLRDGETTGSFDYDVGAGEDEKTIITNITKADDAVLFDASIVNSDYVTLGSIFYEGNTMPLLSFETDDHSVTYGLTSILTGGDVEGKFFGTKITDEKKKEISEPAIEDVAVVEEIDPGTDDNGEEPDHPVCAEDLEKEQTFSSPEFEEFGDDEEDDEPLTLSAVLFITERTLCDFEGALDTFTSSNRLEERKKLFLASYMRELADRIDGGVEKKVVTIPSAKTLKEGLKTDFSTSEDVQAYLKNVTDQLQPMLAEIITSKLAKLRGRLD